MSKGGIEEIGKPQEKLKPGLPEQVLIALALGIFTGVFLGEAAGRLQVIGDIFVRMLQITVIPYISLSLITGIGNLRYIELKALALKGGSVLLLIWSIVLTLVILIPISFPAWPSSTFFSTSQVEEANVIDFFRLFIPSNPFYAYANAAVPAVVVFSILIGIALIGMPKRSVLIEPLSVLHDAMMRITSLISKLSPIGVFALIASAAGTVALDDLARLQVYVVLYAATSLALALIVLPGLITVFTPFRYFEILRPLRTPLITAFATGSSLIVLPMLIEQCKQIIGDAQIKRIEQEEADSAVEVLIPTFYTFPSPMVLLSLSFVLFSGWYIGSDVPVSSYPTLIMAGIPSLFGGTLMTIPFLLDLMKLPSDMFQVFVSVDVITSRFGTLMSAMHYASIGLIGTMLMLKRLHLRWRRLLRVSLICIASIIPVFLGVRAFYTYVIVAPYTKADMLQSLRLQGRAQPATVFKTIPAPLKERSDTPADIEQIRERGVLRSCYQPNEYPSAFYRKGNASELVGFDVEMTHRFAQSLRLPIEFIPATSEQEAADYLNRGICDIYMRTLPVSWQRTSIFSLTIPVYISSAGLIVQDYRRDEFRYWDQLQQQGDSLRIGVENTPGNMVRLQSKFPEATIVPIAEMEEQRRLLQSETDAVDAIADLAEEGAAWTLLFPEFSLVVPRPTIRKPVAYAVAHGNYNMLNAVNAWLLSAKSEGTVDILYKHWMLGEAMESEKPPRWSVIRNVLGWVE